MFIWTIFTSSNIIGFTLENITGNLKKDKGKKNNLNMMHMNMCVIACLSRDIFARYIIQSML